MNEPHAQYKIIILELSNFTIFAKISFGNYSIDKI